MEIKSKSIENSDERSEIEDKDSDGISNSVEELFNEIGEDFDEDSMIEELEIQSINVN